MADRGYHCRPQHLFQIHLRRDNYFEMEYLSGTASRRARSTSACAVKVLWQVYLEGG